jgi:hypothetical protein
MNDELQAQLSQILTQITTSVGEVKDFSVSQLPDIAQQYITYGLWVRVFQAIVFGVVFLVILGVIRNLYQKSVEENNRGSLYSGGDYFIGSFFLAFISIIPASAFVSNVHDLILITTAPKVWFILEIKNLIS